MDRLSTWDTLKKSKKGFMVDYLAVPAVNAKLMNYYGVQSEKELLDIIESDFYYLSCRDISQNESFTKCYKKSLYVSEQYRVCPFGIKWYRGAYESKFAVDEATEAPLRNATHTSDILNHPFPRPEDFDFSPLIQEAEKNSDRIIVGGLWTGIMGDSYRMYGFERFLMDSALNPKMIHTLIDKVTDVYLELNHSYFETLKGKLDVWFFGNDFGSQMGLIMSPQMWYEYFFHNISKLCKLANSYGIVTMMHSCGGISSIIPYLIEAGVQILDPIQITAKGMNPAELKQNFGNNLIFHGGIDTQQILPYGSAFDVEQETKRLTEILGKNGGYILASSQVLNNDVSIENIHSMYQCAKKFRY